jgi:hypothetical protein
MPQPRSPEYPILFQFDGAVRASIANSLKETLTLLGTN